MARIKTYAEDSNISENDIVLGSDFENSGATKNYTFKNIVAYLQGKVGGGPSGSYLPLAGGTLTGALNGTSAVFSSSVTASAFYQTSDFRLKNIISQDGDVIRFTWKDIRDKLVHIGYVAQQIQNHYPDQVKEDNDGFLSVNYIEVLVAKIELLENRIKQLEK